MQSVINLMNTIAANPLVEADTRERAQNLSMKLRYGGEAADWIKRVFGRDIP